MNASLPESSLLRSLGRSMRKDVSKHCLCPIAVRTTQSSWHMPNAPSEVSLLEPISNGAQVRRGKMHL